MTRRDLMKTLAALPFLGFLAPAEDRSDRLRCDELSPEPMMMVFFHVVDHDTKHQLLDSWAQGYDPKKVARGIRHQADNAAQGVTRTVINVDKVLLDGREVPYPSKEVPHLFLPDYSIPPEHQQSIDAWADGDIIDTSWADPTADIIRCIEAMKYEWGTEYEYTDMNTGEVLFCRVFTSQDHEQDACTKVYDLLVTKRDALDICVKIKPVIRQGKGPWKNGIPS